MVTQAGKKKIGEDGAHAEVYRPYNTSGEPDLTIPREDIQSFDVPRSMGPLKDQGELTLYNGHGRYRAGHENIGEGLTDGDRLDMYADVYRDTPGEARLFTGIVSNPNGEGKGPNERKSTYSCTVADFVGWTLSERTYEGGFQERQIAGTEDSVLNTIVRQKCPRIDRSQIATIPRTVTTRFNATNVLKAVRKLVARSEGTMLIASDATALDVTDLGSLTPEYDLQGYDFGTYSWSENSDDLKNYVRLDGGNAEANLEKVTAGTSWTNVTESNREKVQMNVPKSQISSIEIYTDPTRTASGAGLRVRIQKDKGGEPVDIGDNTKDEDHNTLASEFLEEGGFTYFNFGDNDILQEDPWLIVEGDDEGDGSGQDIRVNNVSNPLRIVRYPYPVSTRKSEPESIDEYRLRELQLSDNSITSLQEVGEVARATLSDRNTIRREVEFDARSDRAYDLRPKDVVNVPYGVWRTAGFTGEYVVTERNDTLEGTTLDTTITVQDRKTL